MRELPQSFGDPVSRETSSKLSNELRFISSFSSVDHLQMWKNKNLADPLTRQETNVYLSKYSSPSILDGGTPKTLLPSCCQLIKDSEKAYGNNPALDYQGFSMRHFLFEN